MAVKSNRQLAA